MKKIATLFCALLAAATFAGPGDTAHVITHNQVTVVTNPSTGSNGYKTWSVFPDTSFHSRKITVTLTYKCAPGMNCGAWDYIDNLYIRRAGGVNKPSKDVELVRFITPYGSNFNHTTWNFTWHLDVTDYAMFLHDSIEMEYVHGGYEGTNVGWQVNIDFAMIEGTPVMKPVSFNQLWNGSYSYGNTADPIENHLTPDTVTISPQTALTKIRTIHTGHGEDVNNCSEFCPANRTVKIDNNAVSVKSRWRTCGNNALPAQGGTWLFDRANWCPGSVVQPDVVTAANLSAGSHIFDFDMDPYIGGVASGGNGYAYEVINAHLFQFGPPAHSTDASIEEVYQPSSMSEYNRINPICSNPSILVRNNGSSAATSMEITYGLKGSSLQTYIWTGSLAFGDTQTVSLPSLVFPSNITTSAVFQAYISKVNNQPDQYHYDDSANVHIKAVPPTYDTAFYIFFKTNNTTEDSYYLTDAAGNLVASRVGSNLATATAYRDTLHLQPGCYKIVMYDDGGDGLAFFANSTQGSGTFAFHKMTGPATVFFKTFAADFGTFTELWFFARPNAFSGIRSNTQNTLSLSVFPNPTEGRFTIEYHLAEKSAATVFVYDALGNILQQNALKNAHDFYEVDMSAYGSGFYFVKLQTAEGAAVRKIVKQ